MIYNVQKQQRWDLGEDLIILLESTEPRGILHDNRRILNWREKARQWASAHQQIYIFFPPTRPYRLVSGDLRRDSSGPKEGRCYWLY